MYQLTGGGFVVHTCGVCGMGFLREDVLRLHTATPDLRRPRASLDNGTLGRARYTDFDTHDGEPWGTALLVKGVRLTWYADHDRSESLAEPVTVLEVAESQERRGAWFVLLEGAAGRRWHELEDVVDACFPAGRGPHRADEHAGGELDGATWIGGKVVTTRDRILGLTPATLAGGDDASGT